MSKTQMWIATGCITVSAICLLYDTLAARHNRKVFRQMEQDYRKYCQRHTGLTGLIDD